jgi:hypothetical protein
MSVHIAQTVVEIDGLVGFNTGKSSLHSAKPDLAGCCRKGNFFVFDFHSDLRQRLKI